MLKKDIKQKYKPSMDAVLGQPDTREKEIKHIYKKHYSLNTKEGAQTVLLTITLYDNVKDPKVWVQSSPVSILHCAHFLDYQFEKMSNSAINDNATLPTNNLSLETQKVPNTCNEVDKDNNKTSDTTPNTKDHAPQPNYSTISRSTDASKNIIQVTDSADLTGHDTNIIECSQRVDIGRMLEKYSYHHALKLDTPAESDGSCLFSSIEINLERIYSKDKSKHVTNDTLRRTVTSNCKDYFKRYPGAVTIELASQKKLDTNRNREI